MLELPRYDEATACDLGLEQPLPSPPPEVPASSRSKSLSWQAPGNEQLPSRPGTLCLQSHPHPWGRLANQGGAVTS